MRADAKGRDRTLGGHRRCRTSAARTRRCARWWAPIASLTRSCTRRSRLEATSSAALASSARRVSSSSFARASPTRGATAPPSPRRAAPRTTMAPTWRRHLSAPRGGDGGGDGGGGGSGGSGGGCRAGGGDVGARSVESARHRHPRHAGAPERGHEHYLRCRTRRWKPRRRSCTLASRAAGAAPGSDPHPLGPTLHRQRLYGTQLLQALLEVPAPPCRRSSSTSRASRRPCARCTSRSKITSPRTAACADDLHGREFETSLGDFMRCWSTLSSTPSPAPPRE